MIHKLTRITFENFDDKYFGSRELVFRAGMSNSTLNRHLHALGCESSARFIRNLRMQRARKLLHEGELTINEIGFRVGFSRQACFSKCYNDYCGHAAWRTRGSIDQPGIPLKTMQPHYL